MDGIGDVSTTVTAVFERILEEILTGRRRAGDPVRDRDIAIELGVSRTPVREAIQLLRNVGVIETSPSRFTRIAVLGLQDIEDAGSIVLALYGRIVAELASGSKPLPIEELERLSRDARAAAERGDQPTFFRRCFEFHVLLVELSDNAHLRRSINAVTHALGLAVITNADRIDPRPMLAGQEQILAGLRARDPELADAGVETIRAIGDDLAS